MAIFWIVRGVHSHGVHVWFMECKLHCPLPIRDALVLIPPDSPIPSNALKHVLPLLKTFFRGGVITKPRAHRLRDGCSIVNTLCLATLSFVFLSGWLSRCDQISGIRGFSPKGSFFVRHPVNRKLQEEREQRGLEDEHQTNNTKHRIKRFEQMNCRAALGYGDQLV